MDKERGNLEKLLNTVSQVVDTLLVKYSVTTSFTKILIELTDGNVNNELMLLANQSPSVKDIIELLHKNKFLDKCQHHEQVIRLDKSVLPDGLYVNLYEKRIKSKGEIWIINKYDSDHSPSIPHAHNSRLGLKLHLGNGKLFRKKKQVGSLPRKKLLLIRDKIIDMKLPELSI